MMHICMCLLCSVVFLFFFKQRMAYELRISDWSSDVCSSDLLAIARPVDRAAHIGLQRAPDAKAMRVPEHAAVGFLLQVEQVHLAAELAEIGRASCRERVCQYV